MDKVGKDQEPAPGQKLPFQLTAGLSAHRSNGPVVGRVCMKLRGLTRAGSRAEAVDDSSST